MQNEEETNDLTYSMEFEEINTVLKENVRDDEEHLAGINAIAAGFKYFMVLFHQCPEIAEPIVKEMENMKNSIVKDADQAE